jgi:hypothetical protein
MVSHALHLHRRWEGPWLDSVRVRLAGADLDRRMATGADPHSDRLLALRAARPVTPASRAVVAPGLERVVASVE